MRIMNQEVITNELTGAPEAKIEVYVPLNLLAEKTITMGDEVAAVYVGRLFVNQLKEALSKLDS